MYRASLCACLELPRDPVWSALFLWAAYPLHLASSVSLACSVASFWNVLPRIPGCGTGLGRVRVAGVSLPPPSTISHTQKGSHAATSMQAPNAQQAGNALAVVTMVTGPAAWTTVACQLPAGACEPGNLASCRPLPRLSAPGAALLALLDAEHGTLYPGALGNELPLWEPISCSGTDRPGSNSSSAAWGLVTLNKSRWCVLNLLN